jgi:hypothetical protein
VSYTSVQMHTHSDSISTYQTLGHTSPHEQGRFPSLLPFFEEVDPSSPPETKATCHISVFSSAEWFKKKRMPKIRHLQLNHICSRRFPAGNILNPKLTILSPFSVINCYIALCKISRQAALNISTLVVKLNGEYLQSVCWFVSRQI